MSSKRRAPHDMAPEEYHKCWRKFCLPNYWEALLVAQKSHYPYITTYPCEFCGFFHVGRSAYLRKTRKRVKKLVKLLVNPGFIQKARPDVVELTKMRLRVLLDEHPEIRLEEVA
jgi:hypothetical protein